MTALTSDRATRIGQARSRNHPVASGVQIFAGALVAMNAAGYAQPGTTATGLIGIGTATASVDNRTGADGVVRVTIDRGVAHFANSAGDDAITLAAIGQPCYIVDDQTVALTDDGGARSPAGMIDDVDANGVWVAFLAASGQIPTTATIAGGFSFTPPATAAPVSNGQVTFEATSNTEVTMKFKGSDGVLRQQILLMEEPPA